MRNVVPAVAAVVLLFNTSWTMAEDWPRWRGPRGDGTWRAPRIQENWPADGLKQRWRAPLAPGYAGVVVADGRVITMDHPQEPRELERVVCIDADDGKLLWEHAYEVKYGDLPYGSGPRAAPTMHGGKVFTVGALGHVCCLDAQTGRLIWSREFVKDFGGRLPEWGFASSAVIWNDLIILHPGAADGCHIALKCDSGEVVWRSGADLAGYATPILIQQADAPQIVGWTPEHVVGIDPRDGAEQWKVPYKVTYGVSIATPICVDDIVFVTGYWEGSKAIRLGPQPTDAALLWEDDEHLRGLMSQPIARGGYVYSLDKARGVTCFELASGKKLWDDGNQLTPRGRNPQISLVWLGDSDRVIGLNSEGHLVLARFTPKGPEELARSPIVGPTWAHPAYVGNRVYARDDEKLVCVELPVE